MSTIFVSGLLYPPPQKDEGEVSGGSGIDSPSQDEPGWPENTLHQMVPLNLLQSKDSKSETGDDLSAFYEAFAIAEANQPSKTRCKCQDSGQKIHQWFETRVQDAETVFQAKAPGMAQERNVPGEAQADTST
jgi:hypothetical protein